MRERPSEVAGAHTDGYVNAFAEGVGVTDRDIGAALRAVGVYRGAQPFSKTAAVEKRTRTSACALWREELSGRRVVVANPAAWELHGWLVIIVVVEKTEA